MKTHAEYVSALVRGKFALIIADARAETAGAGAEDISLYHIAQEISPGTSFVLLCDSTDQERETGENVNSFSFVSRKDLHRLKSVINRTLSRFGYRDHVNNSVTYGFASSSPKVRA